MTKFFVVTVIKAVTAFMALMISESLLMYMFSFLIQYTENLS